MSASVTVLAPVKRLELAKLRLADVLSAEQRAELVLAMLEDVLTATASIDASVLVLSPDQRVLTLADRLGATPLAEEPETGSLNDALERALVATCADAGAALVLLPDIPLVTAEELSLLLESLDSTGNASRAVVVPDRREDGTNALLLSPPSALPPRFGERSLGAHLKMAEAYEVPSSVLRLEGMGLDLDTRADVELFMSRPSPTRSYMLLSNVMTAARSAR